MPRKGHTEEQVIAALRQYESGDKTADICRQPGVSQATFYMWKKQYAGLGVQVRTAPHHAVKDLRNRLQRIPSWPGANNTPKGPDTFAQTQ